MFSGVGRQAFTRSNSPIDETEGVRWRNQSLETKGQQQTMPDIATIGTSGQQMIQSFRVLITKVAVS
jgi:hypothetical protein